MDQNAGGDARQSIGANKPPLEPPETLEARIELDHADLFRRAMELDAAGLKLPALPENDAQAGQLADHVVALRKLGGDAEKERLATGKPYRDGQTVINTAFSTITTPCTDGIKEMTRRVDAYRKAKEAKERAEQAEREAQERARAAEQQRIADEQFARVQEQQRLADEAAARVREAATPQERSEAAADMARAESEASAAQAGAEIALDQVGYAERTANALGRAQAGPAAGVRTEGASTVGTSKWTHAITDAPALMASLGPLGPWLSTDAISQAIRAAVRSDVRDGLPGVRIFPETSTVIRGSARQNKE